MQTNYFSKIKNFIKNLFSKKKKTEVVVEDTNYEVEELVAGGFTRAPEHYIKKYKTKESE